jgi:hypothetical protein
MALGCYSTPMPVQPGDLVLLSSGQYEGYSTFAVVDILQVVDLIAEADKCFELVPEDGDFEKLFLAWLIERGMARVHRARELHLYEWNHPQGILQALECDSLPREPRE